MICIEQREDTAGRTDPSFFMKLHFAIDNGD